MRRVLFPVLAGVALALAACGSTPKSDVAALELALAGADQAALAYVNLPACSSAGPVLCSRPATVAQIGVASSAAYKAVKGARDVVNTPGLAEGDVVAALAAARRSIEALQAIVATLPSKQGG